MSYFRLADWTIERTVRTSIVTITTVAVLLTASFFWKLAKDAGAQTLNELTAISAEAAQTRLTEAVLRRVVEFERIAASNVIATALTDSSGREGYLAPFLEQRTLATGLDFELYDYRGRPLIRTGQRGTPTGRLATAVENADAASRDLHFRVTADRIELEAPIRFFADRKPIGYLVGAIPTAAFADDVTLVPSKFYSARVHFYAAQTFTQQPMHVKIIETPEAVLAARLELAPQTSWIDDMFRKMSMLGLAATASVLILSILSARLTARLISAPIADLTSSVKKLRGGQAVSRPQSRMPIELETLSSALFTAFEERGAALQKLENLAHFDTLTGALSRAYFDQRARNMLEMSRRTGEPVTLVYFDLDKFKHVNDSFGHDSGDRLLVAIVHRVQARLRSVDLIGRRGGDEFVIMLPGLVEHGDIGMLAFDLAGLIALPVEIGDGKTIKTGVSMGAAIFPFDAESYDQLVICADRALYDAKKAGRARLAFPSGAIVELHERTWPSHFTTG